MSNVRTKARKSRVASKLEVAARRFVDEGMKKNDDLLTMLIVAAPERGGRVRRRELALQLNDDPDAEPVGARMVAAIAKLVAVWRLAHVEFWASLLVFNHDIVLVTTPSGAWMGYVTDGWVEKIALGAPLPLDARRWSDDDDRRVRAAFVQLLTPEHVGAPTDVLVADAFGNLVESLRETVARAFPEHAPKVWLESKAPPYDERARRPAGFAQSAARLMTTFARVVASAQSGTRNDAATVRSAHTSVQDVSEGEEGEVMDDDRDAWELLEERRTQWADANAAAICEVRAQPLDGAHLLGQGIADLATAQRRAREFSYDYAGVHLVRSEGADWYAVYATGFRDVPLAGADASVAMLDDSARHWPPPELG